MTPLISCWPLVPVGCRYMLSFETLAATESWKWLTRLRLATIVSLLLPMLVRPNVFAGGAAPCTTAVGGEYPVLDALPFVAVTATCIVEPESAAVGVYVDDVAPATFAQFEPVEPHRRHR